MTTRSSLGIIWTTHDRTGVQQAEVPGLILYGYFAGHALPNMNNNDICRMWRSDGVQGIARIWRKYKVASIEVRILEWPAASVWFSVVEDALRWFVEACAVVSWCGGETSSPSVTILNPDESEGIVYAALSVPTGFLCNAGLDDEFSHLNDDQLERLWTVVTPTLGC